MGTQVCALKSCVSQPGVGAKCGGGGFGEEFYSNGSRGGVAISIRCVQGLHSFNPASCGP